MAFPSFCGRQDSRLRKKYTAQGEMGRAHGDRDRRPLHRTVSGVWFVKNENTSGDVVCGLPVEINGGRQTVHQSLQGLFEENPAKFCVAAAVLS